MGKSLEQYAERLLEALESGADWMVGELPAIAQEVLRYHYWYYILGAIVSVVWLCIFVVTFVRAHKYLSVDSDSDPGWIYAIGCIISFVFLSILSSTSAVGLIKVTVAPRMFLIEWLRGFV